MNPAQLLAHFDRISDAPDAIPPLRRFILDLAVRGKLVEQDPRDEPASELLGRIRAEKARLVYAGEIKKGKPLLDIEEDEIPFGIPANWQWVRLNDITSYIQRGKSPEYTTGEGFPVISQKCVQWGGLDLDSAKSITTESIEKYEPIRFLRRDDLLWNSTGTGTIGRVVKVKEPPRKLVCDSHVTVVRCLEVDAEYIRSWLRSDHVYAVIEDRAAGSTNQVELTSQLAMNQVVPLPPLAEQQRIAAKVDELMALCDRLEAAQVERESRRDRLVASSLNRLNNGADPDAFRDHARFYFNHLPRLTTKPEHIQQLRQTILNLAVRGKLVPQDPNDERAEKLTEPPAKKSKSQKGDRDAPFELPATWQWMQLGQISELINGDRSKNYPNKAEYVREGVAWINTGHIEPDGTLSTDSMHYITRKKFDSLRSGKVRPGDLVYCLRGATLGKTAIITQFDEGAVASSLVIVRLSPAIDPRFAYQVLASPLGREQIFQFDNGSAQPNLSANNVKKYWIPIPPLAEQHRTVAKVDELMALCDKLEAQLTTTHTDSRRLLEAVLHEALAPAV